MKAAVASGAHAVGRAIAATAHWLGSWRHVSLCAVIPITAHAHWHLAVQLGIPLWLAPLLPVAVDAYVLASLRAWEEQANRGPGKVKTPDLLWALCLDAVAVAGSHAAGQYDLTAEAMQPIRAGLGAALGVLLVLTLWRVHALDVRSRPAARQVAKPATVVAENPVAKPPTEVDNLQVTSQVAAPVATTRRVAKLDPKDAVLAAITSGREMGMGQIILATGRPRSTVKKAVGELVTDGALVANGDATRPRYRLAEPAKAMAQ